MADDDFLATYREAVKAALAARADAENMDEQRRIVFSQQVLAAGDVSLGKAEHIARASDAYRTICANLAATRSEAADLEGEADYLEKRWETWRSRMASARTEKQMRPRHETQTQDEGR